MAAKFLIDGVIGWDVEFKALFDFFESNKDSDSYTLVLNSPGGLVSEGRSMYDLIKAQSKPVTVEIYQAHSIASVIALAAPTRLIAENGEMLIHLPRVTVWEATENDTEKIGAELKRIKEEILNIYVSGTGQSREALQKIMESEITLSAADAVAMGFANGYIKSETAVSAHYSLPILALKKSDLQKIEDMNALQIMNAKLDELLKGKPRALTIALDGGSMLEVRTSETAAQVGNEVVIENKTPEDGDYKAAENGYVYRVQGGKISAIEQPEVMDAKEVQAFFVAGIEKVATAFRSEIDDLRQKLTTAEGIVSSLTAEMKAAQEEVTALKAGVTSQYTPPRDGNDPEPQPVGIYDGLNQMKREIRSGNYGKK